MLAGIDFSLNSTAISIANENNEIIFFNLYNTVKRYNGKKDINLKEFTSNYSELKILNEINGVNIVPFTIEWNKGNNYNSKQQTKFNKFQEHVQNITNCFRESIGSRPNNKLFALEGYSYNSQTKSLIDIAECTSLLKLELSIYSTDNNVNIFSPSEIKKTATGKGNSPKLNLFYSFLEEKDKRIKYLQQSINNNYSTFLKREIVTSPLDDLIDSYYVLRTLEKSIK
jgi:hypothetical protein